MNDKAGSLGPEKVPTRFIVSSTKEHPRNLPLAAFLVTIIVCSLSALDPKIEKDWYWILGGLLIGLILLETAYWKRQAEWRIDITPLGLQRTRFLNGVSQQDPFIPRPALKDFVVLEHIEVFAVSTHILMRLKNGSVQPVFPNAKMSFARCHALKEQLQAAWKAT